MFSGLPHRCQSEDASLYMETPITSWILTFVRSPYF